VVEAEAELLEDHGHNVRILQFDNASIHGGFGSLVAGTSAVWSLTARSAINVRIRDDRPDIVHFHNLFPLVSPAAYSVARRRGAAVVQTLHNYRLLCSNAKLFRDGRPCMDCVGKRLQWPGIMHGCYHGRAASTAVVMSNAIHWTLGTWQTQVDRYIALTEFAKSLFTTAGLPSNRVDVKPNFAPNQSRSTTYDPQTFLYVGRLSPEKGVSTLLSAIIMRPELRLVICGDGPLASDVSRAAAIWPNISWRRQVGSDIISSEMRNAAALVVPSHWFEGFPVVIAEAFSHGLPVIATELGGLGEIVDNDVCGYVIPSANPKLLADAMSTVSTNPAARERMSRGAYRKFAEQYSPERNYELLLRTYDAAHAAASLQ
jgi:glycosyltransferase involved in cell wall biosynthesis